MHAHCDVYVHRQMIYRHAIQRLIDCLVYYYVRTWWLVLLGQVLHATHHNKNTYGRMCETHHACMMYVCDISETLSRSRSLSV